MIKAQIQRDDVGTVAQNNPQKVHRRRRQKIMAQVDFEDVGEDPMFHRVRVRPQFGRRPVTVARTDPAPFAFGLKTSLGENSVRTTQAGRTCEVRSDQVLFARRVELVPDFVFGDFEAVDGLFGNFELSLGQVEQALGHRPNVRVFQSV